MSRVMVSCEWEGKLSHVTASWARGDGCHMLRCLGSGRVSCHMLRRPGGGGQVSHITASWAWEGKLSHVTASWGRGNAVTCYGGDRCDMLRRLGSGRVSCHMLRRSGEWGKGVTCYGVLGVGG